MRNKKPLLIVVIITVITIISLLLINKFGLLNLKRSRDDRYNEGNYRSLLNSCGISCDEPLAVQAGMDILRRGGNAVDAAVAVSYALSVVQPHASGIGGGGGMLIYPNDGREPVFYDYMETAPASGAMPYRYCGIPGLVKGLEEAHREYGRLEIRELIEPAVRLADEGFTVRSFLAERLKISGRKLNKGQLTNFFPNGEPIKEGSILKQKDLANTLRAIGENGDKAFYEGELADSIVSRVSGITKKDLKNYRAVKRKPAFGKFYDYEVLSAPPPFAGITLIQSLQMGEILEIGKGRYKGDELVHMLSEITRVTYSDRLSNIADPDYIDVNMERLTGKAYSRELVEKTSINNKPGDTDIEDTPADKDLDTDTTHFVVVDKNGMMVSATHSLSSFFGSGVYINGFFMNNHLADFSTNPKSINRPEGNKRPRIFMSPTILLKDNKPVLGIGSPGGKAIPAMISQVLFKIAMNNDEIKSPTIQKEIESYRFFARGRKLYIEGGLSEEKTKLRNRGYQIISYSYPAFYGSVNALYVDYNTGSIYGGADPRRGAKADIQPVKNP